MRRMIAIDVTDLPDPDSPTIPRPLPATEKVTPSTTVSVPFAVSNSTSRSPTSSNPFGRGPPLLFPGPHRVVSPTGACARALLRTRPVSRRLRRLRAFCRWRLRGDHWSAEGVVDRVAEEMERQDHKCHRETGDENDHGSVKINPKPSFTSCPNWRRVADTKAQKAEPGLREERAAQRDGHRRDGAVGTPGRIRFRKTVWVACRSSATPRRTSPLSLRGTARGRGGQGPE